MSAGNEVIGSVHKLLSAPEDFPEAGIRKIEVDGVSGVTWEETDQELVILANPHPGYYMLQAILKGEEEGDVDTVTDYVFKFTGIQYVSKSVVDTSQPFNEEEAARAFWSDTRAGFNLPHPDDQRDLLGHIASGLSKIGLVAEVFKVRDDQDKS